ncbi:tyrosine-protein phosphatase 99A-like [Tigriopus californicus]|nr:tyrosine-protein phosphatase 99A-like [Tigriopus californicus]
MSVLLSLILVCGWVPNIFAKPSASIPLIDDVLVESGTNMSLGCPGMTQNTFVVHIEWTCTGRCGSPSNLPSDTTHTLLKYVKDQGTSVFKNKDRVRLDQGLFSLEFDPVSSLDRGSYSCLINNRPNPDAVIRLNVLDVPQPPGRPMTTGFDSRSVSLTWAKPRKNPDSPVLGYIVTTGWRSVKADDESGFQYLEQELHTNSTETRYTVNNLQPYTVYSFRVSAMNIVGRSKPGKNSYPTVTLMEKPSGKPRVTAAHNTSSTSLYLSWQAPETRTIHGQFLGFKLSYRPRDEPESKAVEVPIENPSATEYTIDGLETYTQYLVSLKVFNPEGNGPETIVVVMTDEGAPSSPRNVRLLSVTDSSFQVSWWEPARANGILQGYRIYYLHNNVTSVQTVKDNKSAMIETLARLEPYTEYKLWIRAYTTKNEGKPSEPIYIRTDVKAPGEPLVVNLTCQNGNTMFLKWLRPKIFYRTVDVYHVMYRPEDQDTWERQVVETVNNTVNHMMYLNNLTTNKVYDLKIQAGTHSQVGDRIMHFGDFSETRRLLLQPGCEAMRTFSPRSTEKDSIILINLEEHFGTIAGIVCGSLGLLLAVFIFLILRRYSQDNSYYYPQEKYYGHGPTPELPGWDSNDEGAIPVHLFQKHVSELHMDQGVGFSKEYEEIRADSCLDEYAAQDSQHPENVDRNRYPNIVAYDHTRVRLRSKGPSKQDKDEYLNANFVDGFRRPRAYIATQGPTPGTFNGFWRMIWEQNTIVIAMITHLFENGKPKCDLYWPDAGSETYGDVVVTLIREDVLASYTLRTFTIRRLRSNGGKSSKEPQEKTIYQYHFTAWPDHGVPLHALPLVTFVRNSSHATPVEGGPIVVHCSAGVGRTGCYIVIDAMMRQIEARGDVNVFSFLKHIRAQRNHLVQTEDQYSFIHDALAEAIESGETHINRGCMPRYIHSLQCIDVTDDKNHPSKILEKQYKILSTYHPPKSQYSSALKIFNQHKNRSPDLLATDSSRVYLNPTSETDGSDYINASWLLGFFDRREFIIAQHPLEHTMATFWQMVWEQEIHVLTLLTSIDGQECLPFWPNGPGMGIFFNVGYQKMKVSLLDELDTPMWKAIRISLEHYPTSPNNSAPPTSRQVWIFHAPSWPQQCSPLSTVFDLIKAIDEEHQSLGGPILTIDRYGGTQAATFACLMSLWHQLNFEGGCDVFQMAKLYHYARPGTWKTQEDYLFMYCALEAFVTNNGTTIPSPVDIEQWRSNPPYQLNGCVRVSRVYTDGSTVGQRVSKVYSEQMGDSVCGRIPPDGQESASLLRHAELNGLGVLCVSSSATNSTSGCSSS